jgi:subtilase family serine protease
VNISRRALAQDAAPVPGTRWSRSRRAGIPVVAAATFALGAGQVALALPSEAATASSPIAVGHAPVLPKGATAAAAPAGSAALTLDIELRTPNSAGLGAYAAAVNDPKSSVYRQFLTTAEVAQRFGASAAEVAAVDSALKAAGLTPGPVSADGLFIPVSTTVAQASKAFGVGFAGYRAAGRSIYANTTAPKVAASIASDVSGIVGLDNIAYATPHHSAPHQVAKAGPSSAGPHASVAPRYSVPSCSNIGAVLGSGGAPLKEGTDYYTATTVSKVYGLSSLLAAGDNGSGVTVAVFELESYDASGVADLDGCYGSSAGVSEILVDGGPQTAANAAAGVGVESALDIENIANLAPGVNIIDYAGPDYTVATDANVLDTYGRIINDNTAQVVSSSWGLCEIDDTSSFISSEATLFAQAAVQGQTVMAASGDNGSTDCYGSDGTSRLSVDDPASQPNVLGVGGTRMTGLTDTVQSTWNSVQTYGSAKHYGATGGGVSVDEARPSYQSGVTGAGYTANCPTASGTGCRQVPDVSALADPDEAYVVETYMDDGQNPAGEYYFTVGGTSGAAPVWAAIYALADAGTACTNHRAGLAAPALYGAGTSLSRFSVFRDITAGNNGISAFHATYSYPAGNGYDLATGWGTPKAAGVAAVACQGAGSVTSAASYYQGVGPVRVLDTRHGTGGTTGPVAKGGTVKLQITGKNGVAASNVTAAVLNVTVTSTTGGGVATVYPDGTPLPAVSNLNWTAGQTVPNLVVVPVGANGAVDLWNGAPSSTVQFIADLSGYFTSDAAASGISSYTAVGPVRALDTRNGTGLPKAKVGNYSTATLPVGGTTISGVSIPSGITALALNVTVTNPTAVNGFVTVYPNETPAGAKATLPITSSLNFVRNETVPNMVIVPVGPDGKVNLYNGSAGTTDLVADVAGYFAAGTAGAKFHSLGPDRILDTRIGLGAAGTAPIAANGTLGLAVPSAATAIVANLTVTLAKSNGHITAYPDGSSVPTTSNVNFLAGQNIPNLAIVRNSGKVDFLNASSGTTALIADISGYFSAS